MLVRQARRSTSGEITLTIQYVTLPQEEIVVVAVIVTVFPGVAVFGADALVKTLDGFRFLSQMPFADVRRVLVFFSHHLSQRLPFIVQGNVI